MVRINGPARARLKASEETKGTMTMRRFFQASSAAAALAMIAGTAASAQAT